LLVVCAVAQPFFATCIVLKTSMRGAGATGSVLRWSFGSMFFHRVIVLSLMSHFGTPTLVWVWIVFSIDQIVQAAVFARLHFRGTWLDARV
jgi:Na+-driven multidrug efflux pump